MKDKVLAKVAELEAWAQSHVWLWTGIWLVAGFLIGGIAAK